ncbi:hypothetical protein A2914_02890 [Candidatus Nomurabacteria bacterium RIFCSPLOWO2_01_FULL_41_21]|uniref:Uncharacterized protein n=2 Tax=Candidatus Nomuraibacteriota TaxID=1752729 RepID=A0A1F6V3I4_9BACT|nr:MAG: hypothetical protein A2733_00975 [Candidatus Nomurabacteria bacterium RIFCSPHIGHO2_01_FULL_40_20]OGI88879.1 MAG: hypothetical protein A2914_02890 [Candidatus Nomurabacteria bacterium RIFCSPLOWO2_01_FULL_41_21]
MINITYEFIGSFLFSWQWFTSGFILVWISVLIDVVHQNYKPVPLLWYRDIKEEWLVYLIGSIVLSSLGPILGGLFLLSSLEAVVRNTRRLKNLK